MLNYVNTDLILFVCSRMETLIVPGDSEAKHKRCHVASPDVEQLSCGQCCLLLYCCAHHVRGLADELPAHPGQHCGSRFKPVMDRPAQRDTGVGVEKE